MLQRAEGEEIVEGGDRNLLSQLRDEIVRTKFLLDRLHFSRKRPVDRIEIRMFAHDRVEHGCNTLRFIAENVDRLGREQRLKGCEALQRPHLPVEALDDERQEGRLVLQPGRNHQRLGRHGIGH